MKFSPDFETVKKIADSGAYNIVPVSCEILSDICTPIEALRILKNVSSHCVNIQTGIVNKCAVRKHPKSEIDRYQAA